MNTKNSSQTKQSYTKPSLNILEQIELLKNRGMLFRDEIEAHRVLLELNYYRLTGYWLSYKNTDDSFSGIYFEDIINTYKFDSELRCLLFGALSDIEISVKTKFAYYISQAYGSHSIVSDNFLNQEKYKATYRKLTKELKRQNQHSFIAHYEKQYNEPLPPVWVCVEVMTFGALSQFVKNLKDINIRKAIARHYNLDISVYEPTIYHLSMLRNDIAHHSRIYNKTVKIMPKIPKELKAKTNDNAKGYIYNTIILVDYLLKQIEPSSDFATEVDGLISKYGIDKSKMGYPKQEQ